MVHRDKGWGENGRYRGVSVYVMMEHIDYHFVDIKDGGWKPGSVQQFDEDPQAWGWNVFDHVENAIDVTLTIGGYPDVKSVERYIDERLKEIK